MAGAVGCESALVAEKILVAEQRVDGMFKGRITPCADGFGPITEPDQLRPTLDTPIPVVESGTSVVADGITLLG